MRNHRTAEQIEAAKLERAVRLAHRVLVAMRSMVDEAIRLLDHALNERR